MLLYSDTRDVCADESFLAVKMRSAAETDGISADLDAYWIRKFGIQRLTLQLHKARAVRQSRVAALESLPQMRSLVSELQGVLQSVDDTERQLEEVAMCLESTRREFESLQIRAAGISREREDIARRRVEIVDATMLVQHQEKNLKNEIGTLDADLADAVRQEDSTEKSLRRAKEQLRLREARHSQRVTEISREIEKARSEWEERKDQNRKVITSRREEIFMRKAELEKIELLRESTRNEISGIIMQENSLQDQLQRVRAELESRNAAIRSILDLIGA